MINETLVSMARLCIDGQSAVERGSLTNFNKGWS